MGHKGVSLLFAALICFQGVSLYVIVVDVERPENFYINANYELQIPAKAIEDLNESGVASKEILPEIDDVVFVPIPEIDEEFCINENSEVEVDPLQNQFPELIRSDLPVPLPALETPKIVPIDQSKLIEPAPELIRVIPAGPKELFIPDVPQLVP